MSFQSLDTLDFGDAADPHGLDQLIDAPRADAGDPGLLNLRHRGLLDRLAQFQEAGEVGASPELGILTLSVPSRVSTARSR